MLDMKAVIEEEGDPPRRFLNCAIIKQQVIYRIPQMQARAVHILLALLILMQSVSTFAAVPMSSVVSPESSHSIMDRSRGISIDVPVESLNIPCHGDGASLSSDSTESCCSSMESAECMLACYSVATAISSSPDLDGAPVHFRHKVGQFYASPQDIPSGLFRPPRSS